MRNIFIGRYGLSGDRSTGGGLLGDVWHECVDTGEGVAGVGHYEG